MKKLYFNLIMLTLGAAAASAAVPEGYYDSLNGLTGKALRQAAAKKADGHKAISYSSGTWDAFKSTDVKMVNGREAWWDMYSSNIVYTSEGHPGMNVEHSVANSWWGGTKNDAYKDLFHLNPSNSDANSRKSNYPLGEIATGTWDNGVTFVGHPVSGQGGGNNYVYEPADEYKGDFARVFMYMFTTYENISWKSDKSWMFEVGSEDMFKPWAVALLLKWHRQDPVSQKEIDRNEAIYRIQGNRNPYIDAPELAEYVWGNKKGEKYYYGEYEPGTEPVDPVDPVDPTDPEVPGDILPGQWVEVASINQIYADAQYIAVGESAKVAMALDTSSTPYASFFQPTAAVTIRETDGVKVIDEPAQNTAVFRFIPSGADYTAEITDLNGNAKGYLNCSAAKNVKLAETATPFGLSITSDGVKLDFGSNGNLYYNPSSPRFTTYTTTGQEVPKLYRKMEVSTVVDTVITGNEEVVRIFNLQGVEMTADQENLPTGIYIMVKADGSTVKINKK